MTNLRIGVLGTARIAPAALLRPANRRPDVDVVAVGSRSGSRAAKWASRHGVPRSYGSYDEVLADPDVDAVYIPLPNSMHAEWTLRALEARKHVLCEKPLTCTSADARRLADAANEIGVVTMEAFHYRYHPLAQRIGAIVASGELGDLRRIEIRASLPVLLPRDIRWNPALGGGALLDIGCYLVNLSRWLAGAEPGVLTASASLTRRRVDRSFEASLQFPRGVESILSGTILGVPGAKLVVRGTRGRLDVINPFLPQLLYRLRVASDGRERTERVADGTTYDHQLTAFVDAVRGGPAPPTSFEDAVSNMAVLDQIRSLVHAR